MAYPPMPDYSKSLINRSGAILVDPSGHSLKQQREAFEVVSRWRACHSYPINTFNSTLRDKVRHGYKGPIVAQRLKRMPTIIDKLQRFPQMDLSRMQDIGGVRAVVGNTREVYKLANDYKSSRFTHKLVGERDYIARPRDEDGYRSVHLIYKYINNRGQGKQYTGLLVELQIRSKLQHTWATAVETMGTLLGQALKSGRGDKEWLDFFAVTSSAFSQIEGTEPIPRFAHLNRKQTFQAVADAEAELEVLQKILDYSFALNRIAVPGDGGLKSKWSYHLIILKSLSRTVEIRSYARDELAKATKDYEEAEKRAQSGEKIESVLVSAGPLKQLKLAYPNFFLDVTGFVMRVRAIIGTVTTN